MKKILCIAVMLLLVAGVAQASILDKVVDYVKERPMKSGISYEVLDHEILASVGTAIVQDAFITGVDIDLLVSDTDNEVFASDNKIVSLGLSYNLNMTANTKLSIGGGFGTKRIEDLRDFGESKTLISALLKYKF
jgi:hypothetical protein